MTAFLFSRFWMGTCMIIVAAGLVASPSLTAKLWPHRLSSDHLPARDSAPGVPPDSGPARVVAEGCVVAYPGAEVVLGAEAGGRLVTLDVAEGSTVRKGQLLAALSADDLRASLAEAEAKEAEAEADIRYYERETRRNEALVSRRAASIQELDAIRHSLETARARLAVAQAQRARSGIDRQDPDHRPARRGDHGAARPGRPDRQCRRTNRDDRRSGPAARRSRGR